MSLQHHSLHDSAHVRIQCICCRPESRACGTVEYAPHDMLVLPLRGVFVKHHEHGGELVTSVGQALFFNAGEGYRISHPTGHGDDCLTLEIPLRILRELLEPFAPYRANEARALFARTHKPLTFAQIMQARLLWTMLSSGSSALAVETLSCELFSAVLIEACSQPAPVLIRKASERSRRRKEQVRCSAVALASRPEFDWTLEQLASHVHASPFHLARAFRAEIGESIHQYLLRVRLTKALEAVLDSDLSFTAIAARFAFATPSHLSAAFRRAYGSTPSEARALAPAAAHKLSKFLTAEPALAS